MTPKILRLRLGCCLCYIPLNLRYSVLIIVLLKKKKKILKILNMTNIKRQGDQVVFVFVGKFIAHFYD